MKASLEQILRNESVMIIDGSMSTALENLGADLNHDLWTAKVLAEQPELVKQVHINYFRAGADCGITCSYQATVPGFIKYGFSEKEAEELIARSVQLFLEAREEWWKTEGEASGRMYPLCLGSVGPYGAYLADGSEYRGHYGVSDQVLYDFHCRRMEILRDAGVDMLLIETQPSLNEVMIEAAIAEELGADYWISFSCADGSHICEGDPIRDCAAELSKGHPRLKMIGVNCTDPENIVSLIREIRKGTDLPIGVYPNSGKVYDPLTKTWTHDGSSKLFGEYALNYMEAGASAVGGCCTTVEEHIRECAKARKKMKNV